MHQSKCVEEIVETATGSRSLSAFLACGTHRSPPVRAKSALATLLCVRRRCYPATRNANSVATPCPTGRAATIASTSVMSRSKQGGGVGSDRIGGGGGGGGALVGGRLGAREMDRLLSALPRFLQVRSARKWETACCRGYSVMKIECQVKTSGPHSAADTIIDSCGSIETDRSHSWFRTCALSLYGGAGSGRCTGREPGDSTPRQGNGRRAPGHGECERVKNRVENT